MDLYIISKTIFIGEMSRPMMLNFIVLIWVDLSFAAHGIDSIIDNAIRGVHLKVYGYEV